jgi:hypothetical protein
MWALTRGDVDLEGSRNPFLLMPAQRSSGASTSRHGAAPGMGLTFPIPGLDPLCDENAHIKKCCADLAMGRPARLATSDVRGGRQRNDVGATTLVQQPNRSRLLISEQHPGRSLECYGSACFDPLDSDFILVPV